SATCAQQLGHYASAGGYFQEPVAQSALATGCDAYGCDSGFRLGGADCGASGCGSSGCGDCCRYFSLFGGWVEADSSRLKSPTVPGGPGGLDLEVEYNTGWLIGGAIGRRLNCNWRFELESAYRNHSFDQVVDGAGGAAPVDGRINVYSGMANIYRDLFGQNACRRWQPYVGAGAGFAFVKADPSFGGGAWSVDDSAFAVQGIAGVTFCTSACTQFFAEYRVFGTDDLCVTTVAQPQTVPMPTDLFSDYLSHNFVFGIRFCR
ncbi:MAG TPA: outer membrane beta-barrel protein, partial [Pirellulaceae bacterium]|nr:outer membrane beta-barrel protein [Pirellulaceae bacterium]